jgi:hypothetical protein
MPANSLDPAPDEALGALLRDALDEGRDALFLQRLHQAIAREPRERPVEVLARWFRPALATAAAAALIGVGLWLSDQDRGAAMIAASAPTAEQVLVAETVPAHEIVLARFMEDR